MSQGAALFLGLAAAASTMTAPPAFAEARLPPIDRGDFLKQSLSHQSLTACLGLPLCFRILIVFIPKIWNRTRSLLQADMGV